MKFAIQWAIIFVMYFIFTSIGCSSVPTSQYIKTFGDPSQQQPFVTVHLKRSTGYAHVQLLVLEYASEKNFTGILGVQYPLARDSLGAKLWTKDNPHGFGCIGGCIGSQEDVLFMFHPNYPEKIYILSNDIHLGPKIAYKRNVPSIINYDDILSFVIKEGENDCVYNVENSRYVQSVSFSRVAVIGTVANRDIITWKRPPGRFRIVLLYGLEDVGKFFESDTIVAAPGESIYVKLKLPFWAKDIRAGWTSNDMFKTISRKPF